MPRSSSKIQERVVRVIHRIDLLEELGFGPHDGLQPLPEPQMIGDVRKQRHPQIVDRPALISLASRVVRPYPTRSTSGAGAASASKQGQNEERRALLGRGPHEHDNVGDRKREIRTTRKRQQQRDAVTTRMTPSRFFARPLSAPFHAPSAKPVGDRQKGAEFI